MSMAAVLGEDGGKAAASRRPPKSFLLEAFPEKLVGGVFASEDSAFAVFDGSKEKPVRALELEPADVVGALSTGDEIVFKVVGDGSRFGIESECAEIGAIGIKGGSFFLVGSGEQSFCEKREGFAIGFEDDVDAHMAGGSVQDQAGGPIIEIGAPGGIAFDGDQPPSAEELLRGVIRRGSGGNRGQAKKNQKDGGEPSHRKTP